MSLQPQRNRLLSLLKNRIASPRRPFSGVSGCVGRCGMPEEWNTVTVIESRPATRLPACSYIEADVVFSSWSPYIRRRIVSLGRRSDHKFPLDALAADSVLGRDNGMLLSVLGCTSLSEFSRQTHCTASKVSGQIIDLVGRFQRHILRLERSPPTNTTGHWHAEEIRCEEVRYVRGVARSFSKEEDEEVFRKENESINRVEVRDGK